MYIIMSISVSLLHISHIIVLSISPLPEKNKTIYLPTYLSICHIFYLSIGRLSIALAILCYFFFLFIFTFFCSLACYSVAVAPLLHRSVACKYLEIVTHTHTNTPTHIRNTHRYICTAVAIYCYARKFE